MQRWIKQTYRNRQTVHRFEQTLEVATLHRQQFSEGFATTSLVICQNHLTNGFDAVAFEEHVLGAAQTNTLCTETEGSFCITWSVGICTNLQVCKFVCQLHQFCEVTADLCIFGSHLAFVNHTG